MTELRRPRTRIASLLLVALTIVACTGPTTPGSTTDDSTGIRGTVTASPVCPVEKNPPDPSCAPRPVAGATIVIRDGSGAQVAAAVSGADGTFFVAIGAGDYVVDPLAVQGLLGTAAKQPVSVVAGSIADVQLDYDTGIR